MNTLEGFQEISQLLIRVEERLNLFTSRLDRLEKRLEEHFVTRREFEAIQEEVNTQRKFIYAGILAFVGETIALVFAKVL